MFGRFAQQPGAVPIRRVLRDLRGSRGQRPFTRRARLGFKGFIGFGHTQALFRVFQPTGGFSDALLSVQVQTPNGAGIASWSPLCIDFGALPPSTGQSIQDSTPVEKFRGIVSRWCRVSRCSKFFICLCMVSVALGPELNGLSVNPKPTFSNPAFRKEVNAP